MSLIEAITWPFGAFSQFGNQIFGRAGFYFALFLDAALALAFSVYQLQLRHNYFKPQVRLMRLSAFGLSVLFFWLFVKLLYQPFPVVSVESLLLRLFLFTLIFSACWRRRLAGS